MIKILIKRLSKKFHYPNMKLEGSSGMDLAANIEKDVNINPGSTCNNSYWFVCINT